MESLVVQVGLRLKLRCQSKTLSMEFSWIGLFLFFRIAGGPPRGPSSQSLLLCFEVWLFNVLFSWSRGSWSTANYSESQNCLAQNNWSIIVCSSSFMHLVMISRCGKGSPLLPVLRLYSLVSFAMWIIKKNVLSSPECLKTSSCRCHQKDH